ncbi:MAG TPA: hypothetical protein VHW00_23975 [Thermoanaerobaculia bacterium]|nr:hypothetical protein [Thermoanaerobaculia bacterium]
MSDTRFDGRWRQVRPDPAPARILLTFDSDGALTYVIAMDGGTQTFALRWRVENETLISTNEHGEESASRFRFASPAMLVLERPAENAAERHVYRREE